MGAHYVLSATSVRARCVIRTIRRGIAVSHQIPCIRVEVCMLCATRGQHELIRGVDLQAALESSSRCAV